MFKRKYRWSLVNDYSFSKLTAELNKLYLSLVPKYIDIAASPWPHDQSLCAWQPTSTYYWLQGHFSSPYPSISFPIFLLATLQSALDLPYASFNLLPCPLFPYTPLALPPDRPCNFQHLLHHLLSQTAHKVLTWPDAL